MEKSIETKKMTLEEYQQKYTNPENIKTAKTFLSIMGTTIGVIIAASLFFVVLKLFEIHQIAGFVGIFFAIIIFIFAYLAPIIKLKNTKSFMTNTTRTSARQSQKYNKQLREEIADKMIDVTAKTEGIGWYSDNLVGKLAVARHTSNDKELKNVLKEIYKNDVKNAANKMIRKSAVNVGFATAISQSGIVDTLFISIYELNLIKDIVYLYGYRPTDSQMVKIYKSVLVNALIAYGASNATSAVGKAVTSGIVSVMEKASQSNNAVTSMIGSVAAGFAGTAIESGLQFVVNTTLTIIIGSQTQKYLIKEYNLQEILDNIELIDSEEEEAKLFESIKNEVKEKVSQKSEKVEKTKPEKAPTEHHENEKTKTEKSKKGNPFLAKS
ncbi:MAG TPA: DUF697 domain-containing protein [Bacilli bacterium]|nr:DUF697 domain-containing protein [Bacilli bacterium]